MAKFRDITSIDPLNIALTATSKKFRVLWLTITLIALIALIVLTAIFTLKYLSEPKAVVTSVKPNRHSFPAVTFCNMNPYKVSALAASPQLAGLVYWYRDALKTTGSLNSGDHQRQKRQAQALSPPLPCDCRSRSNISAYDPKISSSIFMRYQLVNIMGSTWPCGFSCCNLYAPPGKKSRLARTDNEALISFLSVKGLIAMNTVYVGTRGSPPGSYWWYNNVNTPCSTVNIPYLCHNCAVYAYKRNWTEGGPVMITTRDEGKMTAFTNNFDDGNGRGYLCEFYDDTGSEPMCSTGLSSTATSQALSVQVSDGQTGVPTETTATIGVSLVTKYFSGVSNETKQYILAALKNATGSDLSLSATSEDMLPYVMDSLHPNVGSYSLDDIVIRCVYNGYRCKKSDFQLQIDPYYGNCYTYNAFGMKAISNRPGAVGGLSMIYFVDQHQYLDFISSSGTRVIVHDQNSTVFPDVSGYSMPAGYANALAMRLTQEACISTQANPCASYSSDVPNFNYVGKAYSTEGCLRSCFQKHIIDRCHCGDPRIPLPPSNTKVKHCPVTKRDCVNTFYDHDRMKDECKCPAACKRNIYEAITSKTRWTQLYDQPTDKNGTLFDRKKNQLAKIDIYFEDLSVMAYVEKIKYGMFELLLDFSSIAGLFLGMSVMSIFEIWHLILYIRKKCSQETYS